LTIGLINLSAATIETIRDLAVRYDCEVKSHRRVKDLIAYSNSMDLQLIIFQFTDFSSSEYESYIQLKNHNPAIPLFVTTPHFTINEVFRIGQIGASELIFQPIDLERLACLLEAYITESPKDYTVSEPPVKREAY